MIKRKPALPGWGTRQARERRWPEQSKRRLEAAARCFKRGDNLHREGARILAELHSAGMSMKEIADSIGKSKSWVHAWIKWCEGNFESDTPFGPSSKIARDTKRQVEARVRAGSDSFKHRPQDTFDDEDDDADDDDRDYDDTRSAVRTHRNLTKGRRRLLIEGLENLSAKSEQTRLEAARNVATLQSVTKLSWSDLLIPAYDDHSP